MSKRTTKPVVLCPMQIQIFLDTKDGRIRERGLVNVEKGVVDGDERENDKVDFSNEFLFFKSIDRVVKVVGVGEELQGDVAVVFLGLG